MPHNYKFFYFPGRGRGEHIRQLLKLAGAQFEEVVVTQETWPGLKDGELCIRFPSVQTIAS